MCGIAGCIGVGRPSGFAEMNRVMESLRFRGPDECGRWEQNNVVLVHTRLSILDLGGSQQPMTTPDGQIAVTFNGEIYNYRELRRMLTARGYQFRTQGDTEVLLYLYLDRGDQMVDALDGMFAFALYDKRTHRLLIARDRIGIKPLYYMQSQTCKSLVFASDLAGMMANPAVERVLNPGALSQYYRFGYTYAPHTWLRDVKQLEPGSLAVWSNGVVEHRRYYSWTYRPDDNLRDHKRAIDTLTETASEAVTRHLVTDVPLGTFLSGGLDSTAVTALANSSVFAKQETIQSFTMRFADAMYDESARARAIATRLGTVHTETIAEQLPFSRASVDRLVRHLGEPFGDTSLLAVFMLSEQTRRHVKVALSGDGGDELFLGYGGLRKQLVARRLRAIPSWIRRRMSDVLRHKDNNTLLRRVRKYVTLSLLSDTRLLADWTSRWSDSDVAALMNDDLGAQVFAHRQQENAEIDSILGAGADGYVGRQMRFHMHIDLPNCCLFKVDRMSMAHGVEVRVPLLANAMLDYAQVLPADSRVVRGRTKEPLRSLAESLCSVVAEPSPKRGFDFPVDTWVSRDLYRSWYDWEITQTLKGAGFCGAALNDLVNSFGTEQSNLSRFEKRRLGGVLWELLMLGVWMQNFKVRV